MPDAKAFIDTNVFIYLYSDTEQEKRTTAINSINSFDRVVSTQVLNEFCNVCIRKVQMDFERIEASLEEICASCTVTAINEETVYKALSVHQQYGFSYYDSLIIASAIENECEYLATEDMADGQIIDGTLTILNIFK